MKNIFLVTGPSGSGKGTIIAELAKRIPLDRVITTTTRPMRPGESDSHPYHFIKQEEFLELKEAEAFIECAQTYNHEWYGVQRTDLEKAFTSDKIVLWEVDFKGVENIKKLYPDIQSFFISVPERVFRQRLIDRDHPSDEYLESRIDYIREWAEKKDLYDYVIKNEEGQLGQAVAEIENIIQRNLA